MWRLTLHGTLVLLICVIACGHANLNPRIVGGANAKEGAWPWMVSLHNTIHQQHFCGGSLISSEWVLTAAHCLDGEDMSTLLVYLGKRTQQGKNPNQISRTVNQMFTHPSYNDKSCDNDIALLHLSSAVPLNDYIEPVCLAAKNNNFPPGTKGWITGWGDIGVKVNKNPSIKSSTVPVPLPHPEILQEVEVQVYDNSRCEQLCCAGPITPNMICAGTPQGGKGHYTGDSGGSMVLKHGLEWVQFGVISWGKGCAQPNVPGVNTRVSEYQDWIENHTVQNPPTFKNDITGSTLSGIWSGIKSIVNKI